MQDELQEARMRYKAEYERLKAYEPAFDMLEKLVEAVGNLTIKSLEQSPNLMNVYLETKDFIREAKDDEDLEEVA